MEFIDAVQYFSDDQVFDAYTGQLLFLAHTTLHNDKTSSGATARRRTMVVPADAQAPARRVIKWFNTYWLLGNANDDAFYGEVVRRSYGMKKSTGIMTLVTPAGAVLAGSGLGFHAQREYYRDMIDATTSADHDVMWNIYCPLGEPVYKGAFLRQSGTFYRVREVYDSVDEYLVAESDQLDFDAAQTATFVTQGTVNLVTEQAPTTSVVVPVLQTDSQKFYEFRTEAEATYKAGDKTIFIAKSSITPVVGDEFTMVSVRWRVITVVPDLDSWVVRARLV